MAMKIDPFGDLIIVKKKRMALKKPSLKKYPKKPKASSSLEVQQRFLQRCKEVDSHNTKLVGEYKRKRVALENTKKKISSGALQKKRAQLQQLLRSL